MRTPPLPASALQHGRLLLWPLLGVLLLNLLVIAFAIQSLAHSRERTQAQVGETTTNLATLLAHNLASVTRHIDLSLLHLVEQLEHETIQHGFDGPRIDRLLADQQDKLPEVDAFRVSDSKGMIRWGRGVSKAAPASLADRPLFELHRAHPGRQLIITAPIIGRVSRIPVIAFTRSYRTTDGRFGGVITAAVPVEYFYQQLIKLQLGQHGSAVIRHLDMSLLTRFPRVEGPRGALGDKAVATEFVARLDAGAVAGKLHVPKASDGHERIYSFQRVDNFPYLVSVGLSPEDYLGRWRSEQRTVMIFVLGFFLFSTIATLGLRRYWLQRGMIVEQARANEARLLALYASMTEGLAVHELVRDAAGTVIDYVLLAVNPAYENILGLTRQDVIGRRATEVYKTASAPYLDIFSAVASGGPPVRFETSYAPMGKVFAISVFSPTAGQFATVFADITERQAMQQALLQSRDHLEQQVAERTADLNLAKDAAEAASRAKSTFLANMSHELRTPLSAITGLTQRILRQATDPTLIDRLGKVERAAQHLLSVINNILDISKIEAGRLTLEHVGFTFAQVLDNLASLVGSRAEEKGLTLQLEPAPGVAQLALQGDPLRLGQILLNLTANAIKFTEKGTISVRVFLLTESATTVQLRCEVQDSGIGISLTEQARLFTAFEQADGSMTRKYGGTGLGLAISKRFVHMMGGEIGVTSAPGAGSTFWLTVPLKKGSAAVTAPPLPTSPPDIPPAATHTPDAVSPAPTFLPGTAEIQLRTRHAGRRILLAEDEPITQEVSCGLLEDAGLHVDLAEDGQQAVDLARRNSYALILMDMQMPHLNGVDATRMIRTDSLNRDTPILAMTANAFTEDRQACLNAGMNDHIGKPVHPERLYEMILQWLESVPAADNH